MSLSELERVSRQTAKLREQQERLIREAPGSLREIARAAGVSHETVRAIKRKSA